ncbi:MAG: Magnesium transporter MgtE [Chlamydiales bacterium]|nr:Magnesium transporter MgtE [Chlamydiales bacterium]MCH9620171.1 Magnesium transporter MgtE [Chlamydiales bacterium]MCH9623114.1 Magnesium transporter MgtE [Chlamydiales bacterium]
MVDSNVPEKEEHHVSAGNLMDSRISHLDDELSARLEEAFHKTTFNVHLHDVAKIASEYNPIDLGFAASRLPPNARYVLYENLPDLTAKTSFIINTDSATRWAVFRHLEDKEIKEVISCMPADEAVWVLDDIPDRRYRRLIEILDPKKSSQIRELQKHSRNSAGGLMTNEFFAFPMETTIEETAAYIRNNPGIDITRRVFVLDQKGVLQGVVPARNLIVNSPKLPLKQVMQQVDHKVAPDSTREEVVDIVERYKIPVLPVVNGQDFLVGVITYEDVVEAIEDIADETIALMAGTAEDVSEYDHTFKRFLARSPWLLVTLFGGLISASVMSFYQGIEAQLLGMIVFFVPLINGMSGNVGIQCSTVLVRGMATGVLSSGKRGEVILKEATIGLMTGTTFGLLCGLIVFGVTSLGIGDFKGDPIQLGVMVSTGVLSASMTATTLGVSAPFFFAKIGVDPAIASGPIVTAFNDIMSMITFFIISGILYNLFFI